MPIRKSWDVNDINELEMFYFHMRGFEKGNDDIDVLLIVGDCAYGNDFRVEIRFFNIAYIECPTYFDQDFVWRMATEEERRTIQIYAYRIPNARVCCVDERHNNTPPKIFFLASASIEITLFYPDALEKFYGTWGSVIE